MGFVAAITAAIVASELAHGQTTPAGSTVKVIRAVPPSTQALRAWDRFNDPAIMFSSYEHNWNQLPLTGSASHKPWSDTYWPSQKGGAAYRWKRSAESRDVTDPHYYQVLSVYDLQRLSETELGLLSPAEKYDIIQGRLDYPTVQKEAARTSPLSESWFGLCHAVAAANTNFREPQQYVYQVPMPNGRTKNVPLYSSDIKALLAMAIDDVAQAGQVTIGQRCNSSQITNSGACWDTNPASLYLAVTNMIGLAHEMLIIDVDANYEVWNASAWAYTAKAAEMSSISPRAAKGTVKQMRVELSLKHTVGSHPQNAPSGGVYRSELYVFTLELDRRGNVIGGEWLSSNRPDFVWVSQLPSRFGGYYSTLDTMVERLPHSF